tara:strand:- start:343 stop:462 length:120 start_codon:yes stop_codon:yes gene_type:complete
VEQYLILLEAVEAVQLPVELRHQDVEEVQVVMAVIFLML